MPQGKGFGNLTLLNQLYADLSKEQLVELGKKYSATFAILPKKSTVQLKTLYENDKYRVVVLNESSDTTL